MKRKGEDRKRKGNEAKRKKWKKGKEKENREARFSMGVKREGNEGEKN